VSTNRAGKYSAPAVPSHVSAAITVSTATTVMEDHEMRRTDLTEAAMQGWARLDAAQRHRFFEAFLAAALRLDQLALRAWLRRRLQSPPLAAPIDPASFIFADADIALLLRAAGEAAAGPDRDGADRGYNPQGNAPASICRKGRDPIARPGLRTAVGRMCLTSADAWLWVMNRTSLVF
jgi:hypothetical protein